MSILVTDKTKQHGLEFTIDFKDFAGVDKTLVFVSVFPELTHCFFLKRLLTEIYLNKSGKELKAALDKYVLLLINKAKIISKDNLKEFLTLNITNISIKDKTFDFSYNDLSNVEKGDWFSSFDLQFQPLKNRNLIIDENINIAQLSKDSDGSNRIPLSSLMHTILYQGKSSIADINELLKEERNWHILVDEYTLTNTPNDKLLFLMYFCRKYSNLISDMVVVKTDPKEKYTGYSMFFWIETFKSFLGEAAVLSSLDETLCDNPKSESDIGALLDLVNRRYLESLPLLNNIDDLKD